MDYAKNSLKIKEKIKRPNNIETEYVSEFDDIILSSFIESSDLKNSLNNRVLYFTLPSKVTIECITYDTYGIGAIKNDVVVDYISDLSTDLDRVKSFVELCNINGLSLNHLRDVAEDFLTE